jgi:hypothetical protein
MLLRAGACSLARKLKAECGERRATDASESKHLMRTTSSGPCLYLKNHRWPGLGITDHVSDLEFGFTIAAGTRSESKTEEASAIASGSRRTVSIGRHT